jgi:2-amino-4-hydroxy-6-hydroxymethyldihydropteridine diphosphokinase
MPVAAIALGSNLGDRQAHLEYAIGRLAAFLDHLRVSPFHETQPVGVTGDQPLFLNAAATGYTTAAADEVLSTLLAIEQERGRQRPFPNAPRTLDLDLILLGDEIVRSERLVLPHPRFRDRRFVLEPLAEVAPDLRDPITGLSVGDLLVQLRPSTAS